MKDIELRLISELVKNSRRSDRELARVLRVSQLTVTRTRARLEKEGMIDYGGIPNLAKLGYEIIAVVFGKRDFQKHPESIIQTARDFAKRHSNIVFAADGLDLDMIEYQFQFVKITPTTLGSYKNSKLKQEKPWRLTHFL